MKAAIIGMGKQGAAARRILESRGITDFTIFDDKAEGAQPLANFTDSFDIAVISPGIHPWLIPNFVIPGEREAQGKGTNKFTSDVELGLAALPDGAKIVAITGTDGKSTVTALTAAILNAAGHKAIACGNFGLPLCDAILNNCQLSTVNCQLIFVLEISSYMIDLLSPGPYFDAGCILNISPDHLDRYKVFEKYVASKERLREMVKPGAPFFDQTNVPQKNYPDFPLPGKHNASNLNFAIALANAVAELPADLTEIVKNLTALEHRLELVPTTDGIKWYNDSKATTTQAVETALSVFDDVILLMGGRDKGLDFAGLAPKINAGCAALILFGEARQKIHDQLSPLVTKPIIMAETLRQAVDNSKFYILNSKLERASVLLSPGCASFDEFNSFEHRGKEFKKYVQGG